MTSVLVTGGAGYVGSHTAMALAAAGYDLVVYDNLSAGHAWSVDAVAQAHPRRSVRLIEGDIADTERLTRALQSCGATAVLHFAAKLSVAGSVTDPLGYYRNNVGGTVSVLDAMVRSGVRHFVFSSTAATFGEPQHTPIDESHPQHPINPYGETKLAVERLLPRVEHAHGVRSIVLRYFNAAGADPEARIGEVHEPEEHVIPLALRAAREGTALTVFGDDYPTPDGTCVRDFVQVSDLADAHVAALRSLEASAGSNAYNLGSGTGTSIRELLTSVARVTGRPVPHQFGPRRPGDPARLVASSERIRRELGWTPRFDTIDAIVETAWRWETSRSRPS
jgi:UDP-glucose-4-epimerase GalE